MRSKLAFLGVILAAVFVMACPLPQFGPGQSRSAEDGGDQGASTGAGAISVVNDTERHQAVYINENGVRFDVVAEEYPGGPLVACVEVTDFTIVPPSTDPDALPVKALVAGMRDDGTPGVWEIQADDSIQLPQPEDTQDNTARSIVGNDISTLPDGIQTRLGWSFSIPSGGMSVGPTGGIIAGVATATREIILGTADIPKGTTLGVYWRVYALPYTKFCIVSSPKIIGSLQPVTVPPRWRWFTFQLSGFYGQLKLYMNGKFASYLTGVTGVSMAGTTANVTGFDDQQGRPATARIDKYGTITIEEHLPDLQLGALQLPTDFSKPWSVDVKLTNPGAWVAAGVSLSYYVSTLPPEQFDRTTEKPVGLAGGTWPQSIAGSGGSATDTRSADIPAEGPGTYYVYAFADADPLQNYKLDLGTSTNTSFLVASASGGGGDTLDLTLSVTSLSAVRLTDPLSFTANVTRGGDPDPNARLTFSVTNAATPGVTTTPSLTWDAATGVVSGYGSSLDGNPGTHSLSVLATDGSLTKSVTVTIPVKYDQLVIDTYYPTGAGFGIDTMNLFGPLGTMDPTVHIYDDGTNNVDPSALSFAKIVYAPADGLAPGDYFYVRVQQAAPGDPGDAYAIRVLAAPDSIPRDPSWYFPANDLRTSNAQDPYEVDDSDTNGIPDSATTIAVGDKLSRYLDTNDIDWVKVVLR